MLTLANELYQAIIIYDTRKQSRLINHAFSNTTSPLAVQKQSWASCIAVIYYQMSTHDGMSVREFDTMLTDFTLELQALSTIEKLHSYIQKTISALELIMKRQYRLTPNKEVNTAISYMYINLFNKKTVEDISTATNISQRHLNSLFQTHTQLSIHQYYLKLKVERAALLIQVENMTTSELAQLFQFYDESHFIRVFKKHYQASPKQWHKHGALTIDSPTYLNSNSQTSNSPTQTTGE